jgi:hypothetical protein
MDKPLRRREASLSPLRGMDVTVSQRWEHRVVSQVCLHYGLVDAAPLIRKESRELNGSSGLTFAAFLRMFPTFPVWLHCVKIRDLYKTSLTDLFTQFSSTRLWKAYEQAEAASPAGRRDCVVLVGEWLRVLPMFAFHRLEFDEVVLNRTVLCRSIGDDCVNNFCLQDFASLLALLRWTP